MGESFHDVRERGRRQVRRVRLPNDPRSVKAARDEVASVLGAMGWPSHRVDQARVVASELVTNAVLHAGTGFELTVRAPEWRDRDQSAWIEVSDGAPASLPHRADPADDQPGGMGLYLVDAMAAEWGVERDPARKVVWARLAAGD